MKMEWKSIQKNCLVSLCAGVLAVMLPVVCLAAEAHTLKAGAARVEITPKDLGGLWMVWAQRFTGVHDPIFVRALVVDNGANKAALVSTDLVEFGDSTALRQRIERELSIPAANIIITASHDHNAPRGGPIQPGSSSAQGRPYSSPAYTQFVDDSIVAAIQQAQQKMQPARVGVGLGRADINVQRNGYVIGKGWGGADPEGPSEKAVWVVKFESLKGEPFAVLMNYAVHSTVTGMHNTKVTGDLAGAAERYVEKHYQDKVVSLWTMGPAGDQNPRYDLLPVGFDRSKKDADNSAYEAMDAMGLIVGAETVLTADRIKNTSDMASIVAGEKVFTCETVPQRTPASTPAAPANGAAKPAGAPTSGAAPMMFQPNPDFHEKYEYPTSLDIHLSLIRINDIAITGVSGEVFTRIYQHLKKDSPLSNTLMVTMSNGRIGYIGDDQAYDGAFRGASVVRGCAETGIVNGLLSLIAQQ